jgi:hypothetical protein
MIGMDIFGNTDPKKMPEHFFLGALHLDHETSIRANVDKQNYSVAPRHWYIDAAFKCERCNDKFAWIAKEQQVWFEEYRFYVDSQPRHCLKCRAKLRHLSELRTEYDAAVGAARSHGTLEQKRRIIEIISELECAFDRIPEKMTETKELFKRQVKNYLNETQ